jgi:hypothetical protein
MALKDIKARLQTVIQNADPNALVWPRLRNLNAESQADQLIGKDGILHVWFISRETSVLTDLAINQNFTEQEDGLVAEGFFAVSDASDSDGTFEQNADAVLKAISDDRRAAPGGTKLNGTVLSAKPPTRRKTDHVMYGPSQVLCHHTEIALSVIPRDLQ